MIIALEIILFAAVIFVPVAVICLRLKSDRRINAELIKRMGDGSDGFAAGGGGDNLTSIETPHGATDSSPGTLDPGHGGHGGHGCGGHSCGGHSCGGGH